MAPKRQKLKEAEEALEKANQTLKEKQDVLQEVVDRVEGIKFNTENQWYIMLNPQRRESFFNFISKEIASSIRMTCRDKKQSIRII